MDHHTLFEKIFRKVKLMFFDCDLRNEVAGVTGWRSSVDDEVLNLTAECFRGDLKKTYYYFLKNVIHFLRRKHTLFERRGAATLDANFPQRHVSV